MVGMLETMIIRNTRNKFIYYYNESVDAQNTVDTVARITDEAGEGYPDSAVQTRRRTQVN